MPFQKSVRFAFLLLPLALQPALAQQSKPITAHPVAAAQLPGKAAKPTTPTATNTAATSTQPKQEPCWQVAGISKQAMDQKRAIEENAKSQVAEVCADTSLQQQQKTERIREIHQQTKEQADSLITPQQQEAMKECSASRSKAAPAGAAPARVSHPTGGGPCGEMPSSPAPPKP